MKKLIVAALCLATALPVLAADNLSKGCAFYNSGQYDKALAYLQDTVSKNPRVWQGHYYLAHTYLALGQRNEALEQYQICQTCKPTPAVAAACQKVVGQLVMAARGGGGMPDYSSQSPSHQKFVNIERQRLLDQANNDSQRLHADTMYNVINSTNSVGASNLIGRTAQQVDRDRAQVMLTDTANKQRAINEAVHQKMRAIK